MSWPLAVVLTILVPAAIVVTLILGTRYLVVRVVWGEREGIAGMALTLRRARRLRDRLISSSGSNYRIIDRSTGEYVD